MLEKVCAFATITQLMSVTSCSSESRERNPKNQQKDVESRCFLEEIPQYKECTIRERLASTSQEEKLRSCCFEFQGFSAQAAICTSRIHPCLSDFLRLSPSLSLPRFLSPFIVFPADPLSLSLSPFSYPLDLLPFIEALQWTLLHLFVSSCRDLPNTKHSNGHPREKTVG